MRDQISKDLFYKSERLYALDQSGGGGDGGGGDTPPIETKKLGLYINLANNGLTNNGHSPVYVEQKNALDDDWYFKFVVDAIFGTPPNLTDTGPQYNYSRITDWINYISIYEVPPGTGDEYSLGYTNVNSIAIPSNLFCNIILRNGRSINYQNNALDNTTRYDAPISFSDPEPLFPDLAGLGNIYYKSDAYLNYSKGSIKKVIDLKASYPVPMDIFNFDPPPSVKNDPRYINSANSSIQNLHYTIPGIYVDETFDVSLRNSDFFESNQNNPLFATQLPSGLPTGLVLENQSNIYYPFVNDNKLKYIDSKGRPFLYIFPKKKGFTELAKTYLIQSNVYETTDTQNILVSSDSWKNLSLSYQFFTTPSSFLPKVDPKMTITNTELGQLNSLNTGYIRFQGKFDLNLIKTPKIIPTDSVIVECGLIGYTEPFQNPPQSPPQSSLLEIKIDLTDIRQNQIYDFVKDDSGELTHYLTATFDHKIENLKDNSTYGFKAYAKNTKGEIFETAYFYVKTLPGIIDKFIPPNVPKKWHQIYNNWTMVSNGNTNNTIYPFYRISPLAEYSEYNPQFLCSAATNNGNLVLITSQASYDTIKLNDIIDYVDDNSSKYTGAKVIQKVITPLYGPTIITDKPVPFPITSGKIVKLKSISDKIYPIFNYITDTDNSGKESRIFTKDKNYQFRVVTENFIGGCSFSMTTPWGEKFSFDSIESPNNKKMNLYLYTNLNSTTNSKNWQSLSSSWKKNPITFEANYKFGKNSEGLIDVNISENTWTIQGYALFNFFKEKRFQPSNSPNGQITNTNGWPYATSNTNLVFDGEDEIIIDGTNRSGRGWHFIEKKGRYIWLDYNSTTNYPIGGDVNSNFSNKTQDVKWIKNNFIAKKILNQSFNIKFTYEINIQGFGFKVYLSASFPSLTTNGDLKFADDAVMLKYFTADSQSVGISKEYEYVGLQGNQYIIFVCDSVSSNTNSTLMITINNLKTAGGYNPKNNENFITNSATYSLSLPGVNYTTSIGEGSTEDTSSIITTKSNAGNGKFLKGIWETGVWNSGIRNDSSVVEFYDVKKFSSSNRDKRLNIEISGPEKSTIDLNVGDKVAISNIIAIDINEERKLLTKYYTILEKTSNTITVQIESDFPLRRIEKDSKTHRIMVSKNIWVSGVFLNGYFKGIWNNGLFSGYPSITKMDESHWITGIFNGGHFTSKKYKLEFKQYIFNNSLVIPLSPDIYENSKRLSIEFQTEHKLTEGDTINIIVDGTYTSGNSTIISPISLGTTVVVSVLSPKKIITGIAWKTSYSVYTGYLETTISTGLIQNFDFYSNNASKVTSLISMDSKRVFSYNSWIDVNYSTQSAVNIGKPQTFTDDLSGVKYSENNLYGYPTMDILSSNSTFRDSFSSNSRKYKLGTKYKIFDDYVGDSSKFEESFDSTDTTSGLSSFNNLGWKLSKSTDSNSALTFSRTTEPLDETSISKGNELMVYSKGKGGNLNLTNTSGILNRSASEIEPLRYSMVEFDLKFESKSVIHYTEPSLGDQPPIQFNNLNYVTRNIVDGNGITQSGKVVASYLPVYKNVNHLGTSDERKQEFFFNKRNLLMNFRGLGDLGDQEMIYFLDNVKFYQIDMVPFFQYFMQENINMSVQIPNQALAPTIDWVDENQETDIVSNFKDELIIEDIDAPKDINWRSDYSQKRSQEG